MSEYNIQMNKYNALNAEYDQLYPQPMKHASTHAKDGSDPITPADIGAYSKTEADALLANKAPAGYGLGLSGSAKLLTANDDINDMLFGGGWYYYHSDNIPQNAPNLAYTHIVRIDALQGNVFIQTIYGITDGYGYQNMPIEVRRFRYGSMIRPWEYVNPPMVIGVEYRTTERYQGKPVYVKVVNFGAPPAVGDKIVEWGSSEYQPVSHRAIWGNTLLPYDDGDGLNIRVRSVTGIKIVINSNYDWSGQESISVTIKYTKTTD